MWGPAGHVLREVFKERLAQDVKWGEQHHPDGTSAATWFDMAQEARKRCDASDRAGTVTWAEILTEEFFEALAEEDPARLRAELIQVSAVAAVWVQDIDHRMGRLKPKPPPQGRTAVSTNGGVVRPTRGEVRMMPGPKQVGGGSGADVPMGKFTEAMHGEPRWFLVHVGFEKGRYAGTDRELLYLGRSKETVEIEAASVFKGQKILRVAEPTPLEQETVQKWKRPSERRRRG